LLFYFAAMNRTRVDQWLEYLLLALVLAILAWGPLATGTVRPQDFLVTQALTMLAALLWLLRLWVAPAPRLNWPPVNWAVLAFTGYAVARYLTADLEFVARDELAKILVYTLVFLIVINNLARQESVKIIVAVLVLLASADALYALHQYLTQSNRVWHFLRPTQYGLRGSGTYINPSNLAGFLEMILPLALALLLAGRQSFVSRIGLGWASLVLLAGIGVTISRGGWISTALALLVLVALLVREARFRLPALALLGVLLLAGITFASVSLYSQKRFEQLVSQGRLNDVRLYVWPPAVKLWEEHFWFGVGPGHFDWRFRKHRPVEVQVRPMRVHNDYLNTLTDWGTVGAALVASVWGLLALGAVRTLRHLRRPGRDANSGPSNRYAMVLGASVGLLALLFHSVVDFNFHIPANALLAVALMALLAGHWRHADERVLRPARLPARLLLTLGVLACLAWLGRQGVVAARETELLRRADQAEIATDPQLAALKQAHEVDPANFETVYRIGEIYRLRAWQGYDDYPARIREAMPWFELGMKLNPYDGYNHLRYGMCLDWIGRFPEAEPHFQAALERDPNNYFLVAHMGWHHLQKHDYAEAKRWFERSIQIKSWDNWVSYEYLDLVNRLLKEQP
jgi:O-antigen ligase